MVRKKKGKKRKRKARKLKPNFDSTFGGWKLLEGVALMSADVTACLSVCGRSISYPALSAQCPVPGPATWHHHSPFSPRNHRPVRPDPGLSRCGGRSLARKISELLGRRAP